MADTQVSPGNTVTNFQGKGMPMARAGAILAAATRRASPAAKKASPKLKRVKAKKPA